jgi:RNA polymerase sigma factor (sigma-70 family)
VPVPAPLTDIASTDPEDLTLVERARDGSRQALELLITRHQAWIYNIALRMLYQPQDAEDTTQEILVKLITKLSTFEGRSSFRTWLYRLVVNHLLNVKRRTWEENGLDFARYKRDLDAVEDIELPDPNLLPADQKMMIDEARIGCTSGMLLCLDREQRLIYVLGDIFGVTDVVGGELLEISRDNFRQKLARARRDLVSFMQNQCGLVNTANPCRCAKKTRGFAKAGFLNPEKLIFAREHVTRVREIAAKRCEEFEGLDAAYAEIHRNHPFQDPPDFVAALRSFLNSPDLRSTLELD